MENNFGLESEQADQVSVLLKREELVLKTRWKIKRNWRDKRMSGR